MPAADLAEDEDVRTQRRRLAAVWLGAGSALAAMVGAGWYVVARDGEAPGGDMIGHAAAAEWLRTLPWWDWRGWSDWFYGGQAIGVNYPPLGHAWMRFTDPVHGQMAAVAVGLLVLLPWGALRLARAAGYGPRAQRAAVGAVLVLAAASGNMWWVLSGFHLVSTFFGSWPAMLALVVGLHAAAWAARCERPLACGVVAGIALLFNATVVPGIAAVGAVLLATSGASFRQATRWAATALSSSLAVSAWWLVPFLAGWTRLVRFEVPLSEAWKSVGQWGVAVLAVVGVAAAWAARGGSGPSRRLALSALAGLLATVAADLFGYLRPERWMQFPVLVAALGAAGFLLAGSRSRALKPVRPAWAVLGAAFLIVFVVITLRLEALPLGLWLMWRPRRSWAWGTALAWACVLIWGLIQTPATGEAPRATPLAVAAAHGGTAGEGLVYTDNLYHYDERYLEVCKWGNPWRTTAETGGRIRPLFGIYKETSAVTEFLFSEIGLHGDYYRMSGARRPHWFEAWDSAGRPTLDTRATAEALGARWYAACNAHGVPTVTELPGITATGVLVNPSPDESSWHRSAVEWWISISAENDDRPFGLMPQAATVPARWAGEARDHPPGQAAGGVALHTAQDRITVTAETAGWAWLRIPWDPYWQAATGAPLLKGGPGHLIAWVDEGTTELRWEVPSAVDTAAAAVTGAALLAVAVLWTVNRRRGWPTDPGRPRPAASAIEVFADTVDGWVRTATRGVRRMGLRNRQRHKSRRRLTLTVHPRIICSVINRALNRSQDESI